MSRSRRHENQEEATEQGIITPEVRTDEGNTTLKGELRAGIIKITDCLQRISDNLADNAEPIKDPGYIAKQLHFVIDAAEGVQRSMHAHYANKVVPTSEKDTEA